MCRALRHLVRGVIFELCVPDDVRGVVSSASHLYRNGYERNSKIKHPGRASLATILSHICSRELAIDAYLKLWCAAKGINQKSTASKTPNRTTLEASIVYGYAVSINETLCNEPRSAQGRALVKMWLITVFATPRQPGGVRKTPDIYATVATHSYMLFIFQAEEAGKNNVQQLCYATSSIHSRANEGEAVPPCSTAQQRNDTGWN